MIKIVNAITYRIFLVRSYFSLFTMRLILRQPLRGCQFIGVPKLELVDSSSLEVGDGVTVTSLDRYYHLALYSRCKFVANVPGARITIGSNTRIHGSCIHAKVRVSIGAHVLIAGNCQIMDSSGHLASADPMARINTKAEARAVLIEDGVWIGAHSIILPGVTIGRGAVVAAGSVVHRSVEPGVLVAGNPARIVRHLYE